MLALQILIDGFAISSLYALGATGFTLIFGVSGVLNLSHGAIIVVAAVIAWWVSGTFAASPLLGAPVIGAPIVGALAGVAASLVCAFITYGVIVRPIQNSPAIPREEKEIFVLTGTLLWGIMLQEAVAYLFTNNPKTVRPLAEGVVMILGVRTPLNEILTALLSWVAIGLLYLLVNRTRTGKSLLAASMNPRGLTLLGFELSRIHILVWAIYGVLAGIAGVLLGAFLGVSSDNAGTLTASAFSIVVLGGLGSVSGSLVAAYVVGYLETMTAYLVSPSIRTVPVLLLLVAVVYMRPQGLLGRR
jgi:branched-chain amino acid transport system permease protein